MLLIKNAYILDPESGYEGDADILVENGRIKKLYKGFTGLVDESLFDDLEVIDADGWYHCEDTNKDFWFNTPEVIAEKTEYALANGYGGVMVWHYNCDLPSSHPDSLFGAIGTVVK